MTVDNSTSRWKYVGDGVTTQFGFDTYAVNAANIKVYINAGLVVGTYTVVGANNPAGGMVVFTTAPANGVTVAIDLDPPQKQETDFVNSGGYLEKDMTLGLDKLQLQINYLRTFLEANTMVFNPRLADASAHWSARNRRITNLADGNTNTDAATVGQVQAIQSLSGNVPAPVGGQVNSVLIATGAGAWAWSVDKFEFANATEAAMGNVGKIVRATDMRAFSKTYIKVAVIDRDISVPPGAPVNLDSYIVAAGGSGTWAGHDNHIAVFIGGAWQFIIPEEGWQVWIKDEDTLVVWDGTAYVSPIAGSSGLISANINTTPIHDWDPAGWSNTANGKILIDPDTCIRISGLDRGASGRDALLINSNDVASPNTNRMLILTHEDVGSAADNRFWMPDKMPRFVLPGESVNMVYDGVQQRWRPTSGRRFKDMFDIWEDYLLTAGGVITAHPGQFTPTGTGNVLYTNGFDGTLVQKPLGLLAMNTGANGSVLSISPAKFFTPAEGQMLFISRTGISLIPNGVNLVAMRTGIGESTAGHKINWITNTTGNWVFEVTGAGTTTQVGPAITANQLLYLGFFMNRNWSVVQPFYSLDGKTWIVMNEMNTNIPTNPLGVMHAVSGQAVSAMYLDFCGISWSTIRGTDE